MTAQLPDRIVIDGAEHVLLATPLDAFLAQVEGVPELVAPHTANWRGYLAQWRVVGDQLLLDDVRGWVGDGLEVGPDVVLPGVALPRPATWVHGSLRVGMGAVVRYVHGEFESRYEREMLLDVSGGVVTSRRELAATGAMGMAGPYRLDGPLFENRSGGGFALVIAASDLDGQPLVAKAPRPTGGGGGTELWIDTPSGRRPIHVPARAFVERAGELRVIPVGSAITTAVLRAEDEILTRDGGVLLPASLGMWEHEQSGSAVLVMERLEGVPPKTVNDVRAVFATVALAVERGTFDAHGDLKGEHVFIDEDGRLRICDPAPRFADPALRAFTSAYNPRGWVGPAADAVACASMLRYLRECPQAATAWAAELLDADQPPAWAGDHREALARLDAALANAETTSPTSFEMPSGPGWSSGPWVDDDLGLGALDGWQEPVTPGEKLAVLASIDRVVVAGVDVLAGLRVTISGTDVVPFDQDVAAVNGALASVVEPSVVQAIVYGADSTTWSVIRLWQWGERALASLVHPPGYDPRDIELRLPPGVSTQAVGSVLDRTWDAYIADATMRASSAFDGDTPWGSHLWRELLERGTATMTDLAWTAATLTAQLAFMRRDQYVDNRGGLAMVLDEVGATLVGGITAWQAIASAPVARPVRYRMRTLFDAGTDAMVWSSCDAVVDRWDFQVNHFDLPIPLSLAARIQGLVTRYDMAHPDVGDEHLAFGPDEYVEFTHSYNDVCDELARSLGSAYTIETRNQP